jgi:blue copper oxidase
MLRNSLLTLLAMSSFALRAQNPLVVPDTVSGQVINLTMAPGSVNFYTGISTQTLGFNGDYLGPTIILNQGQQVTLNVTNNIGDTTTVHWHGMHVPAMADGGPHMFIEDGDTWSPVFTVLDKAATYWYHPHLHMETAAHVTRGAAGFIIVRDPDEALLDLPRQYGVDDFPLAVQTRGYDATGQFMVETAMDTSVMVNGTVMAFQSVPAQIVRLRLLNAATERVFNFGFSNNMSFYQIGSDGGLLGAPVLMTRLQLAPGERGEILADLTGLAGQSVYLMSYASQIPAGIYGATNPAFMGPNLIVGYTSNPLNGGNFEILRLDVGPALPVGTFSIPATLVTQTPIPQSSADITRTFQFMPEVMGPTGSLLGPFMINGSMFQMNVINDIVILGDTEIWELTNSTRIAHPFHIHDVQFYILDINGVAPPVNMQGRKDVVLVPGGGGTTRFIAVFEDFADPIMPYMYHCHMLTHEDMGMMGQFIVIDTTVSVNELNILSQTVIYPNPSSGSTLHVSNPSLAGQPINWIITDVTGRICSGGETVFSEKGSVALESKMAPGMYLLRLTLNNRQTFTCKFLSAKN